MNVEGIPQYSGVSRGLKQPSKIFKDQDFKLVFVYPMIFADKIPNYQTVEEQIRDFLAVTFLKEIFIENAINITSLASQIRPITDESGEPVNPVSVVMQALASQMSGTNVSPYYYGTTSSPPNYPVSSAYRYELQQKIKEKTAVIYKYTQTDPNLKKLRPYIEIITMRNLIDVPVIVGTKPLQADTITLLHFLIAAVALNLPNGLSSLSNIDIIHNELQRMDEKRYWMLLNNLRSTNMSVLDMAFNYIRTNVNMRGLVRRGFEAVFPSYKKHHQAISSVPQPINAKSKNIGSESPGEIGTILNFVKQNLDQVSLFFRFCLSPDLLKSKIGVNVVIDDSSVRSNIRRSGIVPKQAANMQARAEADFDKLINVYGSKILTSVGVSLHPVPQPPGFEIIDIVNDCITSIKKSTDEIDIFPSIMDCLEGVSYEDLQYRLTAARQFCQISIDFDNHSKLAPLNIGFNINELKTFLSQFEKASSDAMTQISTLEKTLFSFANSDQVKSNLNRIKQSISVKFGTFFTSFTPLYDEEIKPAMVQSDSNLISTNQVLLNIIPTYTRFLTNCIYFYYLCALRDAICTSQFTSTLEIQFERAVTEVTDYPNYSLVLPVEIILALHSVIMSRGWNELTKTTEGNIRRSMTSQEVAGSGLSLPSESYLKQIIKFIALRLNVPNLFVIDSKKGDVYYKTMYQTDIIKTKLNTINTFIQATLNKSITTDI